MGLTIELDKNDYGEILVILEALQKDSSKLFQIKVR